ncbi:MAG TPA: M36 family metallopeptidase, partial [Kofleriaceae bacterium]|nr:M36 family metallopeptidase [Kofleriaceae bacterium]
MVRIRALSLSSTALAAACAAACGGGTSSPPPPGNGSGSGSGSNTDDNPPPAEISAVSLGVTIMSRDPQGAPRLLRSFRPRASLTGLGAEAAARDHVAALSSLWVPHAKSMALATTGVQRLRNGAAVVKLAQQVDGVVVDDGELRVLLHVDGSLAAMSGTMLPAMASPQFASSPGAMLDRALDRQYGGARPRPVIADAGDAAGWRKLEVAPDPQVHVTDSRARRVVARDGGAMVPAWELEVFGDAPPDPLADPSIAVPSARRYLVADATGKILSDTSLTQNDAFVYRVYAETTGNRRPLDGPLTDFSPHPTGFPDGSAPTGTVPSSLVVMDAFNEPIDPWLPANATVASGNNADAFSDLDGTGTFTAGDVRPEVKAGRVLNYHYDTTLEPLATPDQIKAGVISTFYLNNWMHDWWYDSGFTEATGNAQLDNYGRGGVAGDAIRVLAQAGANAGQRDNATMSTPADGGIPRMRIFLFTTNTVTGLTTPLGLPHSEGFSAPPHTFELTGTVAAGDDGVAPANDGCQPYTSDVTGKIVLITFSGVCGSLATVNNAKAAGAIGVILADGAQEDPRSFAGSAAANIPGVTIGLTDGAALAAALAAGPVSVEIQSAIAGPERDGDLDNGVVAHEWGHYLHHRLANCGAQQCAGMSEGWGDFNALMLLLREG